ncbi:MAG: ABC transporter ATP-binding protein [Tannerella sp.]|jgi:ABC-2 type transport system ATP-binding protein|nr:ABC transporter ATP-binding protein [Tannerella sp.]
MENPLISIRNLHKTYPGASQPSVDGLSLQVEKGAFFGLLGPNGAGKTTTVSILCGLCSFDSGEVAVNGLDVRRKIHFIKPLIGVVPQDIALYPELTADENLRFFGGMYPVPSHELNERIETYLEAFGLTSHRKKKTSRLSGGMKRQVNLIAALLHRPALLFLDEPTVGVDVHSRQVIIENLQSLHRNGMTVVYTSHDMKEAERLCTHVALMNHGRIICEGVPRRLISEASVSSLEELFIKKTL